MPYIHHFSGHMIESNGCPESHHLIISSYNWCRSVHSINLHCRWQTICMYSSLAAILFCCGTPKYSSPVGELHCVPIRHLISAQ